MAVTWNSGDAASNITLSGSGLTATTTSATQGAVRANTSFSSGLLYYEALLSVSAGSLWSIGWANATQSITAALGATTNSVVFQPNQTGRAFYNNASLGASYGGQAFFTARIALDLTHKTVWFAFNSGLWNNSSTANPATNTGGYSISTIAAGPYFPVFGSNASGDAVVVNFGAKSFFYPVPAGFSAVDTNTQAFIASSKFDGYAILAGLPKGVSSSKFVSYGVLAGLPIGVSSSKFIGYAVLIPRPLVQRDFPNPFRHIRRRQYMQLATPLALQSGGSGPTSGDDVLVMIIWQ